ncbi:hypothetical protein EYF80_011266 [Liparis tanakae]|uniref:Uncharacterized protein n=1 Tax=Liparis tanakae TaxID=230148 RepID=A0A4Z2IMU0_9TELE|nr:hypothetical protein EYF80_011266 [Liparis tanakae]
MAAGIHHTISRNTKSDAGIGPKALFARVHQCGLEKKSCCNADWRSLGMEKGEEPGLEEGPIDLSGNDNRQRQRGEHI